MTVTSQSQCRLSACERHPPNTYVSCSSPKIPYIGFSHNTASSPGATQLAMSPSLHTCPRLHLTHDYLILIPRFDPCLEPTVLLTSLFQFQVWKMCPHCPLLNPEALAPPSLSYLGFFTYRPHPPVCRPPFHFPSQVIGTVLVIQGSS